MLTPHWFHRKRRTLGHFTTMSSPALGSPINGHMVADDAVNSHILAQRRRSDSDASNRSVTPSHPASPMGSIRGASDGANHTFDGDRMSESEESSADDASHDADFEMQHDAPSPTDHDDEPRGRASSSDSTQAPKRKASFDEEEYIRANPELYGLRRSVRHFDPVKNFHPVPPALTIDLSDVRNHKSSSYATDPHPTTRSPLIVVA